MVTKYLNYLRFLIGLFYIALGIYLIAKPSSLQHIIESADHIRILGMVLAVYGGFRFYRTYKLLAEKSK